MPDVHNYTWECECFSGFPISLSTSMCVAAFPRYGQFCHHFLPSIAHVLAAILSLHQKCQLSLLSEFQVSFLHLPGHCNVTADAPFPTQHFLNFGGLHSPIFPFFIPLSHANMEQDTSVSPSKNLKCYLFFLGDISTEVFHPVFLFYSKN